VTVTRSVLNIWTEPQTLWLVLIIRRPDGLVHTIQENVVTVAPGETVSLKFTFAPTLTGKWEIEVMALDYETRAPLDSPEFAYVNAYTIV